MVGITCGGVGAGGLVGWGRGGVRVGERIWFIKI